MEKLLSEMPSPGRALRFSDLDRWIGSLLMFPLVVAPNPVSDSAHVVSNAPLRSSRLSPCAVSDDVWTPLMSY